LWLDCKELNLGEKLASFIADDCHLWVNNGDCFSEECKDFIRINIATSRKTLESALNNLKEKVNKL